MTVGAREGVSHDVVGLLRWLVQQESTTGTRGERDALAAMAERMRDLIGDAGRIAIAADDSAFVATPVAEDGPILLFVCHIDTVPTGEAASWTDPPLSAHIRDGHLYGRGSSDMKSGLATAAVAVAEGLALGRPVALAVTTGEEAGCLGAPAAADLLKGLPIGAVVIPESTDNTVALGHRGAYWLTVTTHGVAAHGSTPERGTNAVLELAGVLRDLDSLPLRHHPELGAETMNVGAISGGLAHNIVPARASAAIDHRIIDSNVAALHDWWAARADDVQIDLRLDPVWSSAEDSWIRTLPARQAADPVRYFTDASVLMRYFAPETPVVVWGPGDPTTVHSVDEKVALHAVEQSLDMFRTAVDQWKRPRTPAHGDRS